MSISYSKWKIGHNVITKDKYNFIKITQLDTIHWIMLRARRNNSASLSWLMRWPTKVFLSSADQDLNQDLNRRSWQLIISWLLPDRSIFSRPNMTSSLAPVLAISSTRVWWNLSFWLVSQPSIQDKTHSCWVEDLPTLKFILGRRESPSAIYSYGFVMPQPAICLDTDLSHFLTHLL